VTATRSRDHVLPGFAVIARRQKAHPRRSCHSVVEVKPARLFQRELELVEIVLGDRVCRVAQRKTLIHIDVRSPANCTAALLATRTLPSSLNSIAGAAAERARLAERDAADRDAIEPVVGSMPALLATLVSGVPRAPVRDRRVEQHACGDLKFPSSSGSRVREIGARSCSRLSR